MANSVGTLRARLGLDAKPFERGLKGARNRAGAFAKSVARNMAIAGAAMAAAAVAGGAALTRQSLKFIDEQAKVARTIDSSIDGLRALQMAASDAGVGPADLNKSMQMLGARLVEAKVKGGAAGDALKRMGLDAQELLNMDGDARLAAIADRVKELGLSSAQATQFLMDMGIRSKEMALLLTGGGDAIRSARSEVEDLGLSLSEVDAAKVEEANDAMSRIKLVTEALGNRLAVMFAPALQAVAEGFTAAMREGGTLRVWLDNISSSMASFISYFSDVGVIVSSLFEAFKGSDDVEARMSGIGSAVSSITAPIKAVLSGARQVIATIAGAIRVTGSWGGAMAALAPVAREVLDRIKLGFVGLQFQMAAGWLRTKADAISALSGIVEAALGAVNKIVAGFVGAYGAVVAAWDALPDAFARIGALAINALLDKIQGGVGGVLAPLNAILEKFGQTPIAPPNLSAWKVEVGAAVDVAGKAKAAFDAAFNTDYVDAAGVAEGMRQTVGELNAAGDSAAEFGSMFQKAAGAPLASIEQLRQTVAGVKEEVAGASEETQNLSDALEGVGGGAGGSAGAGSKGAGGGAASSAIGKIAEKVDSLKDRIASAKSSMKEMFTSLVTGAKTGTDVLKDLLGKFAEFAANRLFENLWSGGVGALASGAGGGGSSSGGFFKSLFAGFFDSGGSIPSGQFGIAGEKGLEFVNGPATITSRAKTASILGAASNAPSQTFNIDARGAQAGVAEQIASAIRSASGGIAGMAVSEVKQNFGAYSQQQSIDGAVT